MKKISIKKFLLVFLGMLACAGVSAQTIAPPDLTVYNFNDQSCIRGLSNNGKWAVSFGPMSTDASQYANSRLINVVTKEVTVLSLEGNSTVPESSCANDVSDNGLVVGGRNGSPAFWTAENGWQMLPIPIGWEIAEAIAVTPDGHYAVGRAGRGGGFFNEEAVLWDIVNKEIIDCPGSPTTGRTGAAAQQVRYTDITPDGRYINGIVDYSYTQNTMGFVYDRTTQKLFKPGFNDDGTPWVEGLQSAMGQFSPNGKKFFGTAEIANSLEDQGFVPFCYDMETKQFEMLSNIDASSMSDGYIDDAGTMYRSSGSNGPIRTMYIGVDNFWYPLDDLLKLRYGIDFYGKTGYENTGTCMGVSGDGTTITSFPDPYKSYVLRMNETFADAARSVNLLKTYKASPADGAQITRMKGVDLTFNYDVQVLAGVSSKDIKLTGKDGTVIKTAFGFKVSDGSSKVVMIRFTPVGLTAGEEYTITIPAGTIALKTDALRTNEEIVLHYTGRAATPVTVTNASPADGSSLAQLDASTNPLLITFDTDVKLAEGATALLYREGDSEPMATLNLATSVNASESKMVLVYPVQTVQLFLGSNYKVVIPEGAVTDINGDNPCGEYTLNFEGLYERVIISDNDVVYSEDFTNGVANMLLRDGDGNMPTDEMKGYDFKSAGDGYAWVPVRDDTGVDMAVASTSAYTPAGQSDDWMSTPQIYIPDDKCVLEFDAQGFRNAKTDKLKVIVYASDVKYNYLDEEVCNLMRTDGEVLMDEVVYPGASEDNLAGDWKAYSFKLGKYAGKNIYVAFVNENNDQSIVFVDNLAIRRDIPFLTALTSATTVVAQTSMAVTGRVIGNDVNKTLNNVTVELLDGSGNVVDTYTQTGLALSKGDKHDFSFSKELPLTVGESNPFSFCVKIDDLDAETVKFSVKDLAFTPKKRILLEEMTGQDCGNCPRGHLAIENLEKIYGDGVIPVCYHTYTGDSYESGMSPYVSSFLGLAGAPSAKINRGSVIGNPMANIISEGKTTWVFTSSAGDCWLDLVQAEKTVVADAEFDITATYDEAASKISVPWTAKFAINADKQNIGLFAVVTEDGLSGYQHNYYYNSDDTGLGEWGKGGSLGQEYVVYTHNDVARAILSPYNGTVGFFPSSVEESKVYDGTMEFDASSISVNDINNCKIVCVMLNANTGAVINVACAKILNSTGISGTVAGEAGAEEVARYNAAGQMISGPQKGLNIIKYSNGTIRKVIVK